MAEPSLLEDRNEEWTVNPGNFDGDDEDVAVKIENTQESPLELDKPYETSENNEASQEECLIYYV